MWTLQQLWCGLSKMGCLLVLCSLWYQVAAERNSATNYSYSLDNR